jgi:hypothetical protein
MKLTNQAAVRRWALSYAKQTREHEFTRVSAEFLAACEADLRVFITDRIKRHPSKGATLR